MTDAHEYSIDPRLLEAPHTDPSKTDSDDWWNAVLDSWIERYLAGTKPTETDAREGR